jgi:hypothetical protein
MPSINITDLNNAKLDVDHIAELATSTGNTATDRLGNSKPTVKAAINTLAAFKSRGAFAASTAYAVKDVYTSGGLAYVVLLAHTSTSVAADMAAGKVVIHQGATREELAAAGGAALIGYQPPTGSPTTIKAELDKFNLAKPKKTYVVVITGQSNAQGANTGGPNPASPLVKVWDGVTGAWGSSNYTLNPFARNTPDGNTGNNNIGLSFAHRLVDEEGASVYLIYDAAGGRPIEDWMGSGTTSVRYAAIKAKVQAALATAELVAAGKTKIDFLIYAQGEENSLTDDFSAYYTKFATLDKQFRAEAWMTATTPMFVMGMSGLHMRYRVGAAQKSYCENGNRACIYVNSAGLKTNYDVDPSNPANDYTHWIGDSLWEHGYHRIWYAQKERGMSHRTPTAMFYARATGEWNGEADAIALCKNLISIESATSQFPLNGPSATGSISWGYQCSADGNYTMAGGYLTATDNLCNYSFGWGREITFDANGDYSGGFGFQNSVIANYGFVAGRGNTIADAGGAAVGQFSKYTIAQTDPVMWQVGIGTSTAARKNGLAVRKSGRVEMDSLSVYADNAAATSGGLLAGQLYRTATGVLMVRF